MSKDKDLLTGGTCAVLYKKLCGGIKERKSSPNTRLPILGFALPNIPTQKAEGLALQSWKADFGRFSGLLVFSYCFSNKYTFRAKTIHLPS